jgi:hypothetical protein
MRPQPFRQAVSWCLRQMCSLTSLPDNVKLLRKEYLQLAEPYPFSEGMHRKMSEKQTL